ncbi:MAG: PDZ domain-containing protein [bacterium]
MSSPYPLPVAPSRFGGHAPFIASFALLLAGFVPAKAQSRVDVTTRRAPRAENADSTDRQVRRLQRQLDSLTRLFTESAAITVNERRQIELDVSRTIRQLVDISTRMDDSGDRAPRPPETIRLRMTPMQDGAPSAMSKAMAQLREAQIAIPRGWMGIVAEGPGLEPRVEGGEYIIRYLSYPRIVSVDPSSPAQRAGLAPGDTLLAYDGVDVRENDISLTRLLRPNAKVNVRVEREGKLRDFPVIVAAAPTRIVLRRDDEGRGMREPWIVSGVPDAPSFPRSPAPPQLSSGILRAMTRMAPGTPPAATSSPVPMVVLGSFNGVAGAELTTISEGLGKTIGVKSGVLVTRARGAALESGLADGDIIVKAAGEDVVAVADVRDQVKRASENGDHAVELQILRQKRSMKLLLKW